MISFVSTLKINKKPKIIAKIYRVDFILFPVTLLYCLTMIIQFIFSESNGFILQNDK